MAENEKFPFTVGNIIKISLPLIIALSIIKIVTYYSGFNINILQYTSLSELPLFILEDWGMYIMMLWPIVWVFQYQVEEKSIRIFRIRIVLVMGFILTFIISFTGNSYDAIWYFIVIILGFVLYYIIKPTDVDKKDRNANTFYWIFFSLLFFVYFILTFIKGISDSFRVITRKNPMQIEFNDSTTINSNDFYYIGKTEKFIFYLDSKSSATNIIPIGGVKKIKINCDEFKSSTTTPPDTPMRTH